MNSSVVWYMTINITQNYTSKKNGLGNSLEKLKESKSVCCWDTHHQENCTGCLLIKVVYCYIYFPVYFDLVLVPAAHSEPCIRGPVLSWSLSLSVLCFCFVLEISFGSLCLSLSPSGHRAVMSCPQFSVFPFLQGRITPLEEVLRLISCDREE